MILKKRKKKKKECTISVIQFTLIPEWNVIDTHTLICNIFNKQKTSLISLFLNIFHWGKHLEKGDNIHKAWWRVLWNGDVGKWKDFFYGENSSTEQILKLPGFCSSSHLVRWANGKFFRDVLGSGCLSSVVSRTTIKVLLRSKCAVCFLRSLNPTLGSFHKDFY